MVKPRSLGNLVDADVGYTRSTRRPDPTQGSMSLVLTVNRRKLCSNVCHQTRLNPRLMPDFSVAKKSFLDHGAGAQDRTSGLQKEKEGNHSCNRYLLPRRLKSDPCWKMVIQ